MHPRLALTAALALSLPSLAIADEVAPAATETGQTYVAALTSASVDQFIAFDAGAEVGTRLAGPWWGHGSLRVGQAGDSEGSGSHFELRVGAEHQGCNVTGSVCHLVGLDLGFQASTWEKEDMHERHNGPLIAPRLGLDLGGDHLRLRLALEARGYVSAAGGAIPGLGLSAGLAYRL
ncbi:MAG: hypothetical protein JNK64_17430 [Myxococcales bacterium]|nr:hypothetical protein [Myxococcales bacterium]